MKTSVLLLVLLSHVAFSAKHSLELITMASTGSSNLPKFFVAALVNDTLMARCEAEVYVSDMEVYVSDDWDNIVFENDPNQRKHYSQSCELTEAPHFLKELQSLMQGFNHYEGVHILQTYTAYEWDDETDELSFISHHGYDGEDITSFDQKTSRFIHPQAFSTKQTMGTDGGREKYFSHHLNKVFPEWLKKLVRAGKECSLMRTDLPSVSLLQKSPSSPITCHATGFYPNSTKMFWRKDGEELHEDVEYGKILRNHDGSFQMSVELLKLPSEDWESYECVFQLSGVEKEIITKLHKDVIRTNNNASYIIIITISAIFIICVLIAAAYKYYKANTSVFLRVESPSRSESTPESSTEKLRADDDESTLNERL